MLFVCLFVLHNLIVTSKPNSIRNALVQLQAAREDRGNSNDKTHEKSALPKLSFKITLNEYQQTITISHRFRSTMQHAYANTEFHTATHTQSVGGVTSIPDVLRVSLSSVHSFLVICGSCSAFALRSVAASNCEGPGWEVVFSEQPIWIEVLVRKFNQIVQQTAAHDPAGAILCGYGQMLQRAESREQPNTPHKSTSAQHGSAETSRHTPCPDLFWPSTALRERGVVCRFEQIVCGFVRCARPRTKWIGRVQRNRKTLFEQLTAL